MKTAISIPDEIFEQVEERASALGMSRSEFYTKAAHLYLKDLEKGALTRDINAALEMISEDDAADLAVAVGKRRLAEGEDDW